MAALSVLWRTVLWTAFDAVQPCACEMRAARGGGGGGLFHFNRSEQVCAEIRHKKHPYNSPAASDTPATCTKNGEERVLKNRTSLNLMRVTPCGDVEEASIPQPPVEKPPRHPTSAGGDVEEASIRWPPVETRSSHRSPNFPVLIHHFHCSSSWADPPNDHVLPAYKAAFVHSPACQQPPLPLPGTAQARHTSVPQRIALLRPPDVEWLSASTGNPPCTLDRLNQGRIGAPPAVAYAPSFGAIEEARACHTPRRTGRN